MLGRSGAGFGPGGLEGGVDVGELRLSDGRDGDVVKPAIGDIIDGEVDDVILRGRLDVGYDEREEQRQDVIGYVAWYVECERTAAVAAVGGCRRGRECVHECGQVRFQTSGHASEIIIPGAGAERLKRGGGSGTD